MSSPPQMTCHCFEKWRRGESIGFFQWGGFLPGEWCWNEPFLLMGIWGDSYMPQVRYDKCPGCGFDLTRPPGKAPASPGADGGEKDQRTLPGAEEAP